MTWHMNVAHPRPRQKLIMSALALKKPPSWNTNTMYAMAPTMAKSWFGKRKAASCRTYALNNLLHKI